MDVRYGVQRIANRLGYSIERAMPTDVGEQSLDTIRRVRGLTMSSPAAIAALCSATEYVTAARIPGDIVECGVWQGGSMMAVAWTLERLGATARRLWLYDTFAGMTPPGELDVRTRDGARPSTRFASRYREDGTHEWAYASLDRVRKNMASTGYPEDEVRFVAGEVEQTIPGNAPTEIALLRLDTDFHDSTRHELEHLYPRLAVGGVLIVDDYGSWYGVRKAVDEYLATVHPVHLVRVDPTVRLAVKTGFDRLSRPVGR